MTTHKPLITTNGYTYQLDDPDGLAIAHADGVDWIQFDTTYADGTSEGRLQWNSDDGTLEVGMPGGNVNLQIGQETLIRCRNTTGNTINNGSLVTINGAQSNRPKIELFDPATNDYLCGITTEDIATNSFGYVTLKGIVRDVNTESFNEGDFLWADHSNPGGFTNITPTPPLHKWCCGVVLVADRNNGAIFFSVMPRHHLEELFDVNITTANLSGGEAIIWDADNEYWKATGSPDTSPQYSHLKTGWDESAWDNLTLSLNTANYTATLSATADTDYWIEGVRHTFSANTSKTATLNNTEGPKYLILNSADELVFSDTAWDIHVSGGTRNEVTVADGYWSVAQADMITCAMEFHGHYLSTKLHEYFHQTFGTRWVSGLSVSTPDNLVLNVAEGEIYDEDIEITITDEAGSGWWDQALTPLSTWTLYRTGASGNWLSSNTATVPCIIQSNIPKVNTWNGTAWNLESVGTDKYFAYWVFASSDRRHPVYLIPGQAEGGTITEAEENNTLADLDLANLPTAEHKAIAKVIMLRKAASPYYEIAQIDDYRFDVDLASGASSASDHGSLSGLSDDDHTQYVLADGTRGFTGTVNGVTPTANEHLATKAYVDSVTGTTNHSELTNLTADDHTQYILADGTRAFTGTVNGVTPTANEHLATKAYVDSEIAGFTSNHSDLSNLDADDHTQYVLADGSRDITGNLTINGALTVNSLTSTGNITTPGLDYSGNMTLNANAVHVTTTLHVSDIKTSSPVFTINAGGTISLEDNVIVSGNVKAASLNLTEYLIEYAGSPSDNDVLTWVTANSRAEFKTPTGGSGSSGATITSNTTYYLDPTGNDTTGDGSANSPWFTINKAYEALADEIIAGGVTVTIQLNDGTYNYTSTVTPDHPQSSQIVISGTTVYTLNSTNLVSISGTAPNRSMVLTVDDTANCAVGDIIEIRYSAGGTYGVLITGATQITSVNTSNSTITCNFFQGSTTYAPSGAATANIVGHKTMVTFNGCNGFLAQNGNQVNVDKIGFDGVDNSYTLFYAYGTGKIYTTSNDVNAIRFINGAQALYGGYIRCEYASFGYCARGLYSGYGSMIQASHAQVSAATSLGANAIHGAYIGMDYVYIVGGAAHGMVVTNAVILASDARFYANVQNGLVVQHGSAAFCDTATIAWNGSRGLLVQFSCYCVLADCNVVSNGGTGVFYFGQCGGRIAGGSVTYNGNGGVYAGNNSSCQLQTVVVAYNTSYQTSPGALNTLGNNFSFFY